MRVTLLALLALAHAGCSERGEPLATDRLAIDIAPLTLTGVTEAVWTVTVTTNGGANTVWTKQISSSKFGDGHGAAAFVGPCDADAGTNRVTLVLDRLESNGATLSDYRNPTPVWRDVTCAKNADTAVKFDLVIARDASQGFFDVAVSFEDVFCSAKLDCKKDGQPLDLLFHGDKRDTTMVAAFACTSGGTQPTLMHMDALVLECQDSATGITTRMVDVPTRGPGNSGPLAPYVFETASYRTYEQLTPYNKCGWEHAIGLDLDAMPATLDCTLTGKATASMSAWPAGFTPEGAIYPYLQWQVKVIDDGQLVCSQHPLDVVGSGVSTQYVRGAPERFAYTMTCDPTPTVSVNGDVCGGTIAGLSDPVVFADTNEGVVVSVGRDVSQPMPLPDGVTLEGCCLDPCCTAGVVE